jgi:hypothetical protein
MRGFFKGMIVSGGLLAAGSFQAAFAADPTMVPSRDFARAAAATPVGARMRLDGIAVPDGETPVAFDLERFQVFAEDAEITVHGEGGARRMAVPANVYFRGEVEGRPGSRVFLAKLESGGVQGVVSDAEGTYLIGADDAPAKSLGGPLEMHRIEPALLKSSRGGFACGNVDLPPGPGNEPMLDLGAGSLDALEKSTPETAALTATRTARLAIETDYEFFQIFGDATLASNYVAILVGYASTTYTVELGTALTVQSLSLWQTSGDPWTQRNPLCGLLEFGKYWNQNKTGVSRTVAHFLSGRATGGGMSWVGALCKGKFTTGRLNCPELGTETAAAPWGGDYGFTGNLYGEFSLANPVVVWDSYAFAHELGHNFGSPHSHCYNNYGGSSEPIDKCYGGEGGCYAGATSLPGPSKQGTGTIMSYCHMLSGNYQNVSMTFGTGFAWGVQPGREASRMNTYIGAVATATPSCLATSGAPATNGLFTDNFESGSTTLWH